MSQPDAKPRRPAFEELEAALQARQGEHPDRVRLEVTGTSLQGRPVCAATLTNREADDAEKEHVLLTALHSGAARSAAASLFLLMDWLLGQDAVGRGLPPPPGGGRPPGGDPPRAPGGPRPRRAPPPGRGRGRGAGAVRRGGVPPAPAGGRPHAGGEPRRQRGGPRWQRLRPRPLRRLDPGQPALPRGTPMTRRHHASDYQAQSHRSCGEVRP